MARSLILAAFLAGAFAAPAFAEPAKTPFITRSHVWFPVDQPGYRLVDAKTMPDMPSYGVSLRYDVVDAPGLRLDIFVYPIGRLPADQALARGITDVEQGVREKVAEGVYTDLRIEAPTTLDLTPPGPPAAAGEGAATGDDEAASILRTMAELEASDRSLEGRRLAMAFRFDGEQTQSLAYLFYRQLYLVKVRASTSSAKVPAGNFAEAVDAAVAHLVPRIAVKHEGACGNIVVHEPRAEDEAGAQAEMMRGMLEGAERVRREGCVGKPELLELPAGMQEKLLEFPPGAWD